MATKRWCEVDNHAFPASPRSQYLRCHTIHSTSHRSPVWLKAIMTRPLHLALIILLQSSADAFVPPAAKRAAFVPLRSSSPQNDDSSEQPADPFKYYGNSNFTNSSSSDAPATPLDAKVMKKKGGGFKPVKDNRDNLPFVVQVTTPDPYTSPELKKERARKNTQEDRKKNKRKSDNKSPKYTNLKIGGIAANIFEEDDDTGELMPVLGEFKLDKSTTSGDIIVVGDQTYQVQKARCQYKYAGSVRGFEMMRKILEVKPIMRVAEEAVLQRSLSKTNDLLDEPPMLE
jgi:hypothetical protein